MTWVGEQGRELVKLPSGSQVYSHGDSERMAGAATSSSGGGDSGSRTVDFVGDTDRAFARFFAQLVRDRLIVIN
jgi:phage-related tail protein